VIALNGGEFINTFYSTFHQIFDLYMNYEFVFPDPIGAVTPFEFTMFFGIAEILADMVNNVASRRGDDT
jgi:hypothetical protein